MVAIEKEIKGRTLVTLSYMFVHWALDKRTPVQARENGAKPELLSFTKTSFILFWTFTVETCKLILLAVVNFIRYGLLNKINFRRAPPGAGRPPGGALQSTSPSPPAPLAPIPSRLLSAPEGRGGSLGLPRSPAPAPPAHPRRQGILACGESPQTAGASGVGAERRGWE